MTAGVGKDERTRFQCKQGSAFMGTNDDGTVRSEYDD